MYNPVTTVVLAFRVQVQTDRLDAVGLSAAARGRPYGELSTGEKFRADLAKRLCDGGVVDEFTSNVDR
jgi:ABC-type ATPase with predicted acetyltransferase domain